MIKLQPSFADITPLFSIAGWTGLDGTHGVPYNTYAVTLNEMP
jgi:hypothetical protein